MNAVSAFANTVTSASAQFRPGASDPPYTVRPGDTLGAIAARFGTDVATLARINGISNPDRIYAGQQLVLPGSGGSVHTVARGETLGAIARGAGLSLAEVMRANPQIRNADTIYPGDRIALPAPGAEIAGGNPQPGRHTPAPAQTPAPAPTTGAAPVGETAFVGGTLTLTRVDIDNLKKTLQTEWVPSAGDAQAHGIIDTILNRVASGKWGTTVSEVVNANNQFSDINGPVSRRDGRNSVEQLPMAQVRGDINRMVDGYLAQRAAGLPSSIGSHLNYANPNYSDARNLAWINALEGPVLGRGDAIHRHGTVPELQRFRPEAFAIALPGAAAAPAAPVAPITSGPSGVSGGPVDGRAIAAEAGVAIKSNRVDIDSLHPAMAPVIRAVAVAADRLGLPRPVITSGNDGGHGSNSLHYADRALDFRGNNITDAQGAALRDAVREILGPGYDILFETFPTNPANDHLHVEYDPR